MPTYLVHTKRFDNAQEERHCYGLKSRNHILLRPFVSQVVVKKFLFGYARHKRQNLKIRNVTQSSELRSQLKQENQQVVK